MSRPLFVDLDDASPAVVAAIRAARATAPAFARAFSARKYARAAYAVKGPLVEASAGGGFRVWREEHAAAVSGLPRLHLWLKVHQVLDDMLFAHVTEIPDGIGLAVGTTCIVDFESLEDWIVHVEGLLHGGTSLR